ncbi:hypothetical protein MKW98_013742 [Papaver atlanticum]|uniref:Plant thionin family protein n=1 Tax=Papaver atlanticum TaxID=357466 RepID=A0AAD4SDJ8_9MAGN|nr:hypothetical protein MKW98_013742 [Papaver atlanticum]
MGGGMKSTLRMIGIVLLIVGMCLGRISASRESEIACFNKCYFDCDYPNPSDPDLASACIDKCDALCEKSPANSHRKSLAS